MRFLVLVLIVLGASCVGLYETATAEKGNGYYGVPISGAPVKINVGKPNSADPTCTLGSDLAPADASDYFEPPGDSYYTFLNGDDCPDCDASPVELRNAHIVLEFQAACIQPVDIGIVANMGDAACPMPDPKNVVCARATYLLQAPTPGTYEFIVPLGTGCCINQSAFLEFTVNAFGTGCDGESTRPLLVSAESGCQNCTSYNYYPGNQDDLCGLPKPFPGPPIHFVDGQCCTSSSVVPSTWGSLKFRYRGY